MGGVDFPFDFEKALEAVVYLAAKDIPAFDKYKICKLLFLADKYHLVRFGRPITGDRYFALPHGPVPTAILKLLTKAVDGKTDDTRVDTLLEVLAIDRSPLYPRFSVKDSAQMTYERLSKSDREALDEIVTRFGAKTFDELKVLTHGMVAYEKAWSKRKKKPVSKNKTLASVPMAFEDFFEEDSDAVSGAREEMIEDFTLRRVFAGK